MHDQHPARAASFFKLLRGKKLIMATVTNPTANNPNQNLPSYSGDGDLAARQRPPMPNSVAIAVKFMFVGAALALINVVVILSTTGAVRSALRNKGTLTNAQINSDVRVTIVVGVVFGLIGIGLWLWMAFACRAGQSYARIVSTMFFSIGVLGFLGNLATAGPIWAKLIGILPVLVGLGAIIYLWRSESGPYFRSA